MTSIAVYGLGKLGLPLACVLSNSRYRVTGVDPDYSAEVAAEIANYEPNLNGGFDRVSLIPVASDFSFVIVPTPSISDGSFSDIYVRSALGHIDEVNGEGHIAVVVSTVSPGTMEAIAADFPDLDIVYNPTFIALGNVVHGLVRPELLLVGGPQGPCIKVLEIWHEVFAAYQSKTPSHHRGDYTEIELLKLAVNAALGTKISLANQLGMLFESYGVDPAAVAVMGHDPRIGEGYLIPGSPITGPCLPRDNAALQRAAEIKGVSLPISLATEEVQIEVYEEMLAKITASSPTSVGILGLSYKYGVPIDTDAVGPWLLKVLTKKGYVVHCHDDMLANNDYEALEQCDVVVVTQRGYHYLPAHESQEVLHLWS